jgi:hypothetical protein
MPDLWIGFWVGVSLAGFVLVGLHLLSEVLHD